MKLLITIFIFLFSGLVAHSQVSIKLEEVQQHVGDIVIGKIELYKGKPQIVIKESAQIQTK